METKLYQHMASLITARLNCQKSNNTEWFEKHTSKLEQLLDELPHGSGINGVWNYDYNNSNENQIILTNTYDAMNENGYYDKVIDFQVKITASLQFGFRLLITGNFGKYQDIKEYLYDTLNPELDKLYVL